MRTKKPQDCCARRRDNDGFGASIALDNDGTTVAVGAPGDNSDNTDTSRDPGNFNRPDSGAVYIFKLTSADAWTKHAFIKVSDPPAT